MQLFKNNLLIDFNSFVSKTKIISLVLIIVSIVVLVLQGLNLTIEFLGGTNLSVSIPNTSIVDFRDSAKSLFDQDIEIVELSDASQFNTYRLRMKFIDNDSEIVNQLKLIYPGLILNSVDSFGPKLGLELQHNARNAMLLALLLISIYIALRFDRYYALGSVVALLHDVIITLGILALFDIEIGITVIAGILTIIGYSLNDTIVVYDRIRENILKLYNNTRIEIVNRSLNETLNRTIVTSTTTLMVIIVLLIFGGPVLQPFAITLMIGIIIGTYSSIFIASPVMLYFEEKYPIPEFKDEEK
tara:strand:- start:71 stop:973 length:903 start_codon:yes stop_codon:yes gene_type:complete